MIFPDQEEPDRLISQLLHLFQVSFQVLRNQQSHPKYHHVLERQDQSGDQLLSDFPKPLDFFEQQYQPPQKERLKAYLSYAHES